MNFYKVIVEVNDLNKFKLLLNQCGVKLIMNCAKDS